MAGAVCLVGSVVVVLADHGHRWSWPLLGWGLLIGAVGVAGTFAIGRRAGLDPARWDAYPSFTLMAAGLAILAAGLRSFWPDAAFAAYVAVANFAIPLALLPRLRRSTRHACAADASCGATACATCPLAAQWQPATSA